jgi:glucokinase
VTQGNFKAFPSGNFASLDAVVRRYQSEVPIGKIDAACFGVAGPIRDNSCSATNLPWTVHADQLAAHLGLSEVTLVNDLLANAFGVQWLEDSQSEVLRAGRSNATGNQCLIAPGTGLGEAGLFWDGTQHHPFACEGGHTDFAPSDEREWALSKYASAITGGRVSWERIVSGPGLHLIYRFLRDHEQLPEPPWLAEMLEQEDSPSVISEQALAQSSPLCEMALDIFVTLLGAEAGNLALKTMSTGGVFFGGGIVPKIKSRLSTRQFQERFLDKGRMRPLMEDMSCVVLLDDHTALLGAARRAAMSITATTVG